MENKQLSEKESLQLIAQMIQQTQYRLAKNAGTPFLIWGYMTAILSLVIWLLIRETANPQWNFLWFLLPAVCYPVTIYISLRNEQMIKTYIDRIIGQVWTVFGIAGILISGISMFLWHIPILFIILLLMGMGTALSGMIIKFRILAICGILGSLLSIGCLIIKGADQLPFFAIVFLIMMVIPGHALNHMAAKMSAA